MEHIRVRFAPSPTGFVHVGGLRTALYNYLFAKKQGGTFILRIEDTDKNRYVEGATENIIKALKWAQIDPDEGPEQGGDFGPYYQSLRTKIYLKFAQQLVDNGKAYYAFDTPDELENMRIKAKEQGQPPPKYDATIRYNMRNSLTLEAEKVKNILNSDTPYVVRLLVPENRSFQVNDIIRGDVTFASSQVDDQILIKSDGFPTYHLANVVDDHLMEISHVIRGEEWLSSVPKHLYLYECFGWEPPVMAHLPLIFNPDGTKMSKRDIQSLSELPQGKVDPDVQSYINSGYEREAVINYIALLGWNPGDDREVFSIDELVKEFSIQRVNKSASIFDLQKLNWLNAQHLGRMETNLLSSQLETEFLKRGLKYDSKDYFTKVVALLQSRLHFRQDFFDYSQYFFQDPDDYDPQVVKKRWKYDSAQLIVEFINEIDKLECFTAENLESTVRKITEVKNIGGGRLIHPVRLAVSGVGVGPGLFEMIQLLGKETVSRRLKRAMEKLESSQN